MKSQRQISSLTELAVSKINDIIESVETLKIYGYGTKKRFNKQVLNRLIKDTCKKYSINETHVRIVGDWVKNIEI